MSVEEGEVMDVENLLESCWGNSDGGNDSIIKKYLRKKKVEDWKRRVLWKHEASVMAPTERFVGGGDYELEEGEFVPSDDDRVPYQEDVSPSSAGVVELEEGEFVESPVDTVLLDHETPADELNSKEEGEFVDSLLPDNVAPVGESNSKEEDEFMKSLLPENETRGGESKSKEEDESVDLLLLDNETLGGESNSKEEDEYVDSLSSDNETCGGELNSKEENRLVGSLLRDNETRGDESNSKEESGFVDLLFLDYEYPGDEEGEFVGLATVDGETLTPKEECELGDDGFCQQFQSSEKQKFGQGCEDYAEPVNEVQKHHGLSNGLANDFKVEGLGTFVDCGVVELSDSSISSHTPDGAKSSVPIEAPYSETTKTIELRQIETPESMVLDSPKCFDSPRESINPSEAFESQTSKRAQIINETQLRDSVRDANGPDAKNIFNTVSHSEEKDQRASLALQLPVNSTLPESVQLKVPAKCQALSLIFESFEQSLYKNPPQRSVSAYRTFPAGCGRQSLLDNFGGCQKSVQNFLARTLGDGKSFGKYKPEQIVRANAKQRREEVTFRDAFKEKWERNMTQGVQVTRHVQVREDLDGKLKEKHMKGTSSMLSRDREIGSSIQERGLKSMTFSNDMSIKTNFIGEYVEGSQFRNPPLGQKYGVMKPSAERVTIQALNDAANCPWRLGLHARRLPICLPRSTTKGIAKKRKLMVGNVSNSVPRKSYDAALFNFFGHYDEEDDSPLCQKSRNTELNSTPSSMSTFNVKDFDTESGVARNRVRKTLRLFQTICRILLRDEEGKPSEASEGGRRRVDLKSATILKENNKCLNAGMKILGAVPGVEVGDEFHYRAELVVIGLHTHYQNGIDYLNRDGKTLATSIVASGGYDDFMDSSDVLVYSGQGGNPTRGALVATDQKLVRGNLALKNSMDEQTPVRVIRGFKEAKDHDTVDARSNMVATLTYDGLYLVEKYWQQKGSFGNNVFMFQLRKISGQPKLAIKELKNFKKAKLREGICMKDISHGKERIPIGAVNTIDNEKHPTFVYLAKMKHSVHYNPIPPKGCQCKDGCFGSNECACAIKNGGQIPYSYDGAIVESRPLVYECGPKCQCPPSCRNRVSQNGIKFPLELFKTKFCGWGVRSLKSIPSGSFICEYTGELIQETDAEQRTGNDEYLFDVGRDYDDHTLWEGLSSLIPSGLKSITLCESVEDVGFTIDAAHQGNIGRFINHSCSPNLYAQNVLYDHDDKRMPHIMLFAAENIPPLEELTYHYNMAVGQVRDQDGNIKKKKCYCGSSECTGRIY